MTAPVLVIEERDDTLGTWRGMRLLIELGRCDPAVIRDQTALCAWTEKLAARIDMQTYGGPLVEHFGRDELAGHTVIQLIETSNIDVHGYDDDLSATLCVFSCQPFDPLAALEFTVEFFDAGAVRARVVHCYIPA